MIYHNVLDALGNTPMIELQHMTSDEDARVLVKYEGLNVGGSIKTRTAFQMIEEAEKRNELRKGMTIVEATSGNQGIGLALVGAVKGYSVVIIMPDSVSQERRKLIQQYGAKVVLIHDSGNIGDCIDECIQTALQMKENDEGVFLANQFNNFDNVMAHYQKTGQEIIKDVEGSIDAFCAGIGTGGTLTGVGKALKEQNSSIHIVAIEPEHAAILSGGKVEDHLQMGIGDGLIPAILDQKIYDEVMIVSDDEAIQTARLLAEKEGLLVGISSGSNVAVALRLAKRLGKDKTVVTVLPDTGERYFSTELFRD